MTRSLLFAAAMLVAGAALADEPSTPPSDLEGPALAAWIQVKGCPGCSLSGAFGGLDFGGADLRGATFACTPFIVGAACTEGGVDDAGVLHLEGADLRAADVQGIPNVRLDGAQVEGAVFYAAFPPSLLKATFETVRLGPTYGSASEPLAFSRAEIELLAPYVKHWEGAWGVYGFELGAGGKLAPSYDCGKASTETEKAICAREDLAALDRALSATYRDARARLGDAAVKQPQRKWLAERNRCGGDSECLGRRMRERLVFLSGQLTDGGLVPANVSGKYHPTHGLPPRLPDGLAGTETGRKLQALLRHDSDSVTLTSVAPGRVTVEGFALGANGHTCTLDGTWVQDATSGWYRPEGVADDSEGELLISSGWLEVRNAFYWCGARASLDGLWLRAE